MKRIEEALAAGTMSQEEYEIRRDQSSGCRFCSDDGPEASSLKGSFDEVP